MKKILFSIALFLSVAACNKSDDALIIQSKENEYSNLNKSLTSSFSTLFKSPENLNFVSLIDKKKGYSIVNINLDKNSEQTRRVLIDGYFTNLNSVQKNLSFTEIYKDNKSSYRVSDDGIDSYIDMNHSEEYGLEIKSFIKNIENAEVANVPVIINDFNNIIYSSKNLSNDEKLQLIAFSALTNSFSTFVKEGGLDEVQGSIMVETGLVSTPASMGNGRVAATCQIKWRDAFRGGVEGFFGGAVRGAWLGATVGTVTVPGIGTVTGAVSGAVVLGAVGFVSGVGGTIAKQVIWDCVLRSTSVDAGCQYYFDMARNNSISIQDIPSNCLGEIKVEFTDLN